MEVGTVVCFCDPDVTFEQGSRDTYIAALGDSFREMTSNEKWRMFPGDKVWLEVQKVKPEAKTSAAYALVEITDRNGGDGKFNFRCGDIQGEFYSDSRGYEASVSQAVNYERLELLKQQFPKRFRSIDQF